MNITDNIFIMCPSCKRRQLTLKWEKDLYVCPVCGKYLPMGAYSRLNSVLDVGTMEELDEKMEPTDPIGFPDYLKKVKLQQKDTGLLESVITAKGRVGGIKVVCAVLDSHFFMGSMSSVVGEKVTRAIEYATEKKRPLIIFSASGGARMQEGIFSLMQMAKTADAVEEFSRQGGLYISVLTHPTTGGVTASFATLGDITIAEPGALIGFAGPRVIEQTIGQKLPKGFQRAEYLQSHGFVDKVIERKNMKEELADILRLHQQGISSNRGMVVLSGANNT